MRPRENSRDVRPFLVGLARPDRMIMLASHQMAPVTGRRVFNMCILRTPQHHGRMTKACSHGNDSYVIPIIEATRVKVPNDRITSLLPPAFHQISKLASSNCACLIAALQVNSIDRQ
jgi:hypothetical protein